MTSTVAPDSAPAGTAGPEGESARTSCDWRFLLPIGERSRVLDLTGDDAVTGAISADAAEVLAAGDLDDLRLPPAERFDVILLHDAWDAAPITEAASIARLRRLRARLAEGGILWLAGSRRGAGAGVWTRRLARAGFAVTRRFALLPDARHAVGIRPLEHEIARAVDERLPGPLPRPVLDAVRRAARPFGWVGGLVPSYGLVARAAGVRR